ncbi:MAG: VWA domain-containing protein [Anaerolineae bacterium]
MRNLIPILLAAVLWLSASPALADGMILPKALSPDRQGVAVRYHHVTVTIEDYHAVTRVEQEFYNPHDVPVMGRYLFPVPPDAILSGFKAKVDGVAQTVTRQDAAATNAELYASLAQSHDPSLLQYADWQSLAFDLRLPPGGSRVMTLEYEEVLVASGGLVRYRYVLSTERYSSLPLDEASVTVDVSLADGLTSLYSPSHAVRIERLGAGYARASWQAQYVNPAEDFELFFAPAESGFGGGLLTGERNGDDHFLFLFSPEADPGPIDALPKDIVFVIDRSGSMSGEKILQARDALAFILDQLGEADRFSIVAFDDRLSMLADELQPVEWRSLDDARRFVYQLSADGSTDLGAALQSGLEVLERSEPRGAPRMLVFLTDGLPTAGVTDEALIAKLVAETNARLEARLHVFGVGYDVNTHLLDQLAAGTLGERGSVTYVQPDENLEAALTGFYSKIGHPLLTDVEVEFEGLDVDQVYPERLPDLFQGSSLLLTGRYEATSDRVAVRVRGWAGSERRDYVYRFDLAETRSRDFVPRLWATRRVGALLDQVRVEGERDDLVEEIRGLGLSYGIVTPYTTFVVAAQAEGAASGANMELYRRSDLNAVSGQTTVRARVQNQMYQQAAQANLAVGANVSNVGRQSLVQVGARQVDLSLLHRLSRSDEPPAGPLDETWIEGNVEIDRTVAFGSEAYFDLAADPEAREFLQSGPNVVFEYGGEVIAVRTRGSQATEKDDPRSPGSVSRAVTNQQGNLGVSPGDPSRSVSPVLLGLLLHLFALTGVAMLFGLAVVTVVVAVAKARS